MKKMLFIILLTVVLYYLESMEFVVQSFSIDKNDLRGLVEPEYDSNGDYCSLIRIETDAEEEIYLIDIEVIRKKKEAKGIYYFYLSHREKRFSIISKGYMPLDFNIPEVCLQTSKVYILRIKTKENIQNNLNRKFSIDFYLNQVPDSIYVDDERVILNPIDIGNKFILSLLVTPERHEIRFVKAGFQDIISNRYFTANEKIPKVFKEFMGIVTIQTIPDNVYIEIENMQIGYSPIYNYQIKPGEYIIEMKYENHEFSRSVSIKGGENKFVYNLDDFWGNLVINTIPKKVQVYFEDECIGASPIIMNKLPVRSYLFKFAYQSYKLPYYINLNSGDNVININIKEDLLSTIKVKSDRNYKLLIYGKKYNIVNGTTIVKNKFVSGEYKYGIYILLNEHNKDKKLTPFYKEIKIGEETINLKPGINIIDQKLLEDRITTLNINTLKPSKIYLNKSFIGNNNQTIELEPGKYNLLIKFKNSKERVEETIELLPGVNDINY